MAIGKTYSKVASQTLGSDTSSVTFSNVPQNYTDLILVAYHKWASGTRVSLGIQLNSDTSLSSYSDTGLYATGSANSSGRETGNGYNFLGVTSDQWQTTLINFYNYSNGKIYKSYLSRSNSVGTSATQNISAMAHLWSSASPVSTIKIYPISGNFLTGSIFTIYGIAASKAPKAIGGTITTDGSYWYHKFTSSGLLTPQESIDSAEVLVVAGGGGGAYEGNGSSGAGGAGGLLGFTSQSLLTTSYSVTVGGGGSSGASHGSNGTNGSDSQFGSLTLVKGGGAANFRAAGSTGGSGGGGADGSNGSSQAGGSGTSGQGNTGGTSPISQNNGSGGGGAGATGGAATGTGGVGGFGGVGGVGSSSYSSWGLATNTGENSSGTVYYAGGGGGGTYQTDNTGTTGGALGGLGGGGRGGAGPINGGYYNVAAISGSANTGGGGGGGANRADAAGSKYSSGSGGSGIVIVRYAV